MSTYTDLHNRIKDNITVLRRPGYTDDGMTPQLVKFMNPENEYYGTFKGAVSADNAKFINATLDNSTIKNSVFNNCTMLDQDGNALDLGQIQTNIQEISSNYAAADKDLHASINGISEVVKANEKESTDTINTLSSAILSNAENLSLSVKNINERMQEADAQREVSVYNLNNMIDLVSANAIISIDAVATHLAETSVALAAIDSSLDSKIDETFNTVQTRLQQITETIDKDRTSANETHDNLNKSIANVGTTIYASEIKLKNYADDLISKERDVREHAINEVLENNEKACEINRHFSIVRHFNRKDEFEATDYAINKIDVSTPLAYVKLSEDDVIIGKIINVNTDPLNRRSGPGDRIKDITVKFYEVNTQYAGINQLIKHNNGEYHFTLTNTIKPVGSLYEIKWNSGEGEYSINDISFEFSSKDSTVKYDVYQDELTNRKGFATNCLISDKGVESCYLQLQGADVELTSTETLSNGVKYILSGQSISVLNDYVPTYGVKLSFDANVSAYIPSDFISTVEPSDSIDILNVVYDNAEYKLSANGTPVDIDDKYALAFNGEKVNLLEKHRIYKYECVKFANQPIANIVLITDDNMTIDDVNLTQLTAEVVLAHNTSCTVILEKQLNGEFNGFDPSSDVSVSFNGYMVEYKVTIPNTEYTIASQFAIDHEIDTTIYNDVVVNTTIENVNALIDLADVELISETYDKATSVVLTIASKSNNSDIVGPVTFKVELAEIDRVECNQHIHGNTHIKMKMPKAIPGKSREFILNIGLTPSKKLPYIPLKIVDQNNDSETFEFEFFGKKVVGCPKIKTGKHTYLTFKEISQNKFIITDLDNSFLYDLVNHLDNDISKINQRCDDLNNAITNIYATVQNAISTRDIVSEFQTLGENDLKAIAICLQSYIA